ncbi:MAG: TlpA family protein disulfide reductase [Lachnospiraceae bacterium]|nr:TlpA family protein disulfide reductase [Lachnospiraceae bacterium]
MIKVLSEGDTAPDFTAALCNGESFKLSDHKDKVVLINFWATWCGPCVREMPAFERLKADAIDGFELVCVNCMEDKKTVDQFVKDEGYTFNIAYDTDGSIGMYYPTEGIPYTLIVDHGVISRIYVGAMDAETQYNEYKSAIEEAMK